LDGVRQRVPSLLTGSAVSAEEVFIEATGVFGRQTGHHSGYNNSQAAKQIPLRGYDTGGPPVSIEAIADRERRYWNMAKRKRPRWGQIVTLTIKLLVAIASVIVAINQSGPSR
jgi:hypothetical protein